MLQGPKFRGSCDYLENIRRAVRCSRPSLKQFVPASFFLRQRLTHTRIHEGHLMSVRVFVQAFTYRPTLKSNFGAWRLPNEEASRLGDDCWN